MIVFEYLNAHFILGSLVVVCIICSSLFSEQIASGWYFPVFTMREQSLFKFKQLFSVSNCNKTLEFRFYFILLTVQFFNSLKMLSLLIILKYLSILYNADLNTPLKSPQGTVSTSKIFAQL